MRYSSPELLLIIKQFYIDNSRPPKWDELPFSKELLRHRFGSFTAALIAAEIPTSKRIGDALICTCEFCGDAFKSTSTKQRFCGLSCSAKRSKHLPSKTRTKPRYECIVCNRESINKKFCSKDCRTQHAADRFSQGLVSHRRTLRVQMDCTKCSECGLSEWRGKILPLELDHIDGNAGNNMPANLRMLCSNCHSITDTWKNKNKGNGRKSRGLSI